jgi:hypothetical protein
VVADERRDNILDLVPDPDHPWVVVDLDRVPKLVVEASSYDSLEVVPNAMEKNLGVDSALWDQNDLDRLHLLLENPNAFRPILHLTFVGTNEEQYDLSLHRQQFLVPQSSSHQLHDMHVSYLPHVHIR